MHPNKGRKTDRHGGGTNRKIPRTNNASGFQVIRTTLDGNSLFMPA